MRDRLLDASHRPARRRGHRRAAAYLLTEPGRWDLFRQYRLLNPKRYEPAGRVFVRWQVIGTLALMLWWLVGGAVLVFPR